MNLFRQSLRLAGLRTTQQDHELLATVACHQVGAPPLRLLQQTGHLLQTLVPLGVTEVIVVGLELIHIDHQHRQQVLMAARPLPFPLHGEIPVAAVGDAGQRVLQRQQRQALVGLLQRPVGLRQLHGALADPLLQFTIETLKRLLGTLTDQQLGEHGRILLEDLALIGLERSTPQQVVGRNPADRGGAVPQRHHGVPAATHLLLFVVERRILQHQHIILAAQRLLHRGVIRNGTDEVMFVDQLARLVGTPSAVHGLELGVDQEDGDAIELQILAGQHHGLTQQLMLAVAAGELNSHLM